MSKKAQNWSIEMILTTALFMTFFVTFVTFSFFSNSTNLVETEIASNDLLAKLLSGSHDGSIIGASNTIDGQKLIDLSTLSYGELSDVMSLSDDFCITLEDRSGNIIPIDNKYGVGSDEILINGVGCTQPTP